MNRNSCLKSFLLCCLVGGFVTSAPCQQLDLWEGAKRISLLTSTESNVIDVLGKSKPSQNRFWTEYQTEFEELFVEYSRGSCKLPSDSGWRVDEGVVTRLFYAPKQRRKPSYFGLKPRLFSKKEVSDAPGNFVYESDIRGISFGVRIDGTVGSILLYPGSKFDNLRCGQDQRSTR
jgi:hypothetical protein